MSLPQPSSPGTDVARGSRSICNPLLSPAVNPVENLSHSVSPCLRVSLNLSLFRLFLPNPSPFQLSAFNFLLFSTPPPLKDCALDTARRYNVMSLRRLCSRLSKSNPYAQKPKATPTSPLRASVPPCEDQPYPSPFPLSTFNFSATSPLLTPARNPINSVHEQN